MFVIKALAQPSKSSTATSVQGKFYQSNGGTSSLGKSTPGGRGTKVKTVPQRKSIKRGSK